MSFAAVVDNPRTPKREFLSQAALSAARAFGKQATEQRESKMLTEAFEPGKRYSPMETAMKLANLNVNPEKKKFIWAALEQNQEMDKAEIAANAVRDKQMAKDAAAKQERERKGKLALKYAGQLNLLKSEQNPEGLSEEEVLESEPSEILSLASKKNAKGAHSDKAINPDQQAAIKKARAVEGFDQMDEVQQLNTLLENGVSRENADTLIKARSTQLERQNKEVEASFKANEDFIRDTTNSYKAFETETKPKLLGLQDLNRDDGLISATQEAFLNALNIPIGVIDNPSSEAYQKLSQDLLKGLPDTYGNRILKVEVDNFLKTIPTLSNSKEGRRMIASQLLKLGQMKEVFYNEMRKIQKNSIDKGQKLPLDFEQEVFDNVKPQIDKINNQFQKMLSIKAVPANTVPFFNPSGTISFIPNNPDDLKWAESQGGERIW